MSIRVVAKFQVHDVTEHAHLDPETQERVVDSVGLRMGPVYAPPGTPQESENRKFWENTPGGQLQMTVTNKAVFGEFVKGAYYYLTFERSSEEPFTPVHGELPS